jgi:hypothetical protein
MLVDLTMVEFVRVSVINPSELIDGLKNWGKDEHILKDGFKIHLQY